MNMLMLECMFGSAVCWVIMHPCMFSIFSILFQNYMHVLVHAASFPDVWWFDSVIIAGQRVRDVTEWYQRKGCSMGLNGPWKINSQRQVTFCPAKIRKLPKKLLKCLNHRLIGRLSRKLFRCSESSSRNVTQLRKKLINFSKCLLTIDES